MNKINKLVHMKMKKAIFGFYSFCSPQGFYCNVKRFLKNLKFQRIMYKMNESAFYVQKSKAKIQKNLIV